MSSFDNELLLEINSLRGDPKGYAKKVRKYVDYFKGNVLRIPGSNAGISTEEGKAAYIEASDYLEKQSPVPLCQPSKGLRKIAQDFLKEVQNCDTSDIGEIDIEEIIAKYGEFRGNFSRALDFGGETPEQALINLLVSDGDTSRSQRTSLLNPELIRIGVATGVHGEYRYCSVILTCTQFKNTVDSDDFEKIEGCDASPSEQTQPEGKTLKPKKHVIRDKPQAKKQEPDDDFDVPEPGVKKVNRSEKIVIENGKKKRIVKIVKIMDDGSKETETIKEDAEDDDE